MTGTYLVRLPHIEVNVKWGTIHSMPDMPSDSPVALRDMLMATTRTLRKRWHQRLQPWDLSPHEYRALRIIGGAEQPIRLGVIAQSLRIVPRSATEVVDRLEAHGLAERVPDPADRRAVCVRLTDHGRDTFTELDEARDADADAMFTRLDSDERRDLAHLLAKLLDSGHDDSRPQDPDRHPPRR